MAQRIEKHHSRNALVKSWILIAWWLRGGGQEDVLELF
jgi:hypothetical protein